jgi:hypothetical protein
MPGRRPCLTWRIALLASSLVSNYAFAQINWGGVRGSVTDQTGSAVPGAFVSATSDTLPRGLSTTTDDRGWYSFPALPVGQYTINVIAPGFSVLRFQNLNVKLGEHLIFHARLSLGSVTESIDVSDSASSLETSSSQTVTTITANAFDSVARGRGFHTILMMAPGVRNEVKTGAVGVGGVSVDGASGSENTYYIDGVDVSDVISGALRAQNAVPLEFVSQLQVKSGGFEAEFGGATGGVINVATRGGSNSYHGELLFQATSGRWNAADRGYYQRSPVDASTAEFFVPRKDSYRILYPGFSGGGPLLRNQLFGFVSYMPERELTRRTIGYAPGDSRAYSSRRAREYAIGRIDLVPRSDLQWNAAWVWSPAKREGALPVRDSRIKPPANDFASLGEFVPSQTFSVTGTYSPTSRVLMSLRYGYKYLNSRTNNYGLESTPYVYYRMPSWTADNVPEAYSGGAGFQTSAGSFAVDKDITARHNINADVSRVSSFFGQQHIIKAGYGFNRIYNDISDGYAQGRFDIFWGDAFSRGSFARERGAYGYYIWEDGPRHDSRALGHNRGFYVQDTWRALPTLTINAGVRLESEYLPPYTPEINGIRVQNPVDFGWGEKIAPRLGAAWDIGGRGRWKLSGSFGLFYDMMKYTLAREAFGGDYWVSHVYRLDRPDVLALNLANPGLLGERITSYNNRSLPINERGELRGIDPGLRPYTTREISISLDHALTSRLQLGVRYTRKQLLRAIEDIGVLDESESEVYLIGNPGFGLTRAPGSIYAGKTPDGLEYMVPKARRDYDGLEFRLEGQIGRTHVLGSYTLSRLYGNYAGLANSDEAGRMDPSISRSFDLPTYYFDSSGRQRNVEGRLATDRPHVFKLFGWREFQNRFGASNIGLTLVAMSGSLNSTTVGYLTAPTFPFGRGDLGRMPVFTQTDINFSHTFRVSERMNLRFEAVAMNALNQAAVVSRVTQINRAGNINNQQLPLNRFFSGYNVFEFLQPGSGVPLNPIYGLPGSDPMDGGVMYKSGRSDLSSAFMATNPGFGAYQGPRTLRLGIRLTF